MTKKRIYVLSSNPLGLTRFAIDDERTIQETLSEIKECLENPPITFLWPTNYKVVTQAFRNNPTYYGQFKCGKDPFRKALPGHEGLDMRAYDGTPIRAAYSGIVKGAWPDNGGAYGNQVRIVSEINGETYEHTYAHLKSFANLKEGDPVAQGDVIAFADSTGKSTGPHLHLMVKKKGATERGETDYPCDIINPEPLFKETR